MSGLGRVRSGVRATRSRSGMVLAWVIVVRPGFLEPRRFKRGPIIPLAATHADDRTCECGSCRTDRQRTDQDSPRKQALNIHECLHSSYRPELALTRHNNGTALHRPTRLQQKNSPLRELQFGSTEVSVGRARHRWPSQQPRKVRPMEPTKRLRRGRHDPAAHPISCPTKTCGVKPVRSPIPSPWPTSLMGIPVFS